MVELISPAEYARRRGVSRAAVTKAIRTGRITLIGDKLDPHVADVQWQRNTHPSQAIRKALAQAHVRTPAAAAPASPAPPAPGGAERDDSYLDGRRREQLARAALAELELAEKHGRLVNAEQLRPAYQQMIVSFRTELLALPGKIKAEVELQHGISIDTRALVDMIEGALGELSRYDPTL